MRRSRGRAAGTAPSGGASGLAIVTAGAVPAVTLSEPPVSSMTAPVAAHDGFERYARTSVSLPRTRGRYAPTPWLTVTSRSCGTSAQVGGLGAAWTPVPGMNVLRQSNATDAIAAGRGMPRRGLMLGVTCAFTGHPPVMLGPRADTPAVDHRPA